MEVPEIVIPQIKTIQLPTIPTIEGNPYQVLNVPLPNINLPGCVKTHRDSSVKNTAIIEDDPGGAYFSCPTGELPSYTPIDYNPRELTIIEEKKEEKINTDTPKPPEQKQPEIPKKEKEEIVIPDCPGPKDQRIKDFRNESRLERVIGHKRGDDGIECITLYENVPFKDQFIPEISVIVSTALIGLVAASSPLLLNLVKPLVKNLVKKLTKKKNDIK